MSSLNFTIVCSECGKEAAVGRSNAKTCPNCRLIRKERVTKETGRRRGQNVKFKTSNPNYSREYSLRRYYGITIEQYQELLAGQNGGCAVCGRTEVEEKKALAVDHDHGTGEIFGLLCYRCNHGIIGKQRNPELFKKAAEYLAKGTGLFVPDAFKKGKKRRRRVLRRKENND